MVNFKDIYHVSRFQRGSNIFQGVQLFPGGVQLLILYRNPLTCDFPGGGGSGPPVPLLDPHLSLHLVMKANGWLGVKTW